MSEYRGITCTVQRAALIGSLDTTIWCIHCFLETYEKACVTKAVYRVHCLKSDRGSYLP
jgi:hypothetical protein